MAKGMRKVGFNNYLVALKPLLLVTYDRRQIRPLEEIGLRHGAIQFDELMRLSLLEQRCAVIVIVVRTG